MVNKTTVHRFDPYWSFDPEQDVKRLIVGSLAQLGRALVPYAGGRRFKSCSCSYPEQDVKRLNRTVVERKHIGLIIQRTQDQNLAVRYFLAA